MNNEMLEYNVRISRNYAEAEQARDRWAQEHGCVDFAEAIRIGLQEVGRRPVKKAEAA